MIMFSLAHHNSAFNCRSVVKNEQTHARTRMHQIFNFKDRLGSNSRTLLVQQCGLKKVEPFDIPSQPCGNVCDQHDHTNFVSWFLSNISDQQICA